MRTLPPASGPTPTAPVRPATASCPTNVGIGGARPPRHGPLEAVDFDLRWPPGGPVALRPQASAARPDQATVRIASSTPHLSADGTSLMLSAPLGITYVLESGQATATGSIRFTSVAGPDVSLTRNACRGNAFVLYDVDKATLQGSPLRIVGTVAPPGAVTISTDGGTARFRSSAPGDHTVTLLTASDAGVAGDVIKVTVTVD